MTSARSRVASEFEAEIELPAHDHPELELGSGEPVSRQMAITRLLWDQRALILRWSGWGLIIATLLAFLVPATYDSTTRLMPPDSTQAGMGGAILAALSGKAGSLPGPLLGGMASDMLGTKSSGALFVEILRSRTVHDRLVNRFDLRKVYGSRYMVDAGEELGKHTRVAEDRKSGVISIAVEDRSRERAAQLAQAYVEELDRLVAEVSTSSARRERIFIEGRLGAVKNDLDHAEEEFSQFASKNTTLDIKEQTKAMVESGAVLQGQLIAAQSELQGLEQVYTESNVRVRALKARIAELQHQLQKLGGDSSMPSLEDQPSYELYPPIRKLPLLGVRWMELYRETKIQETVYELLTQQYELAKIQEAKEIPTVKVLDRAFVPEKKSFPPRLLIIALGTLLAVVISGTWVVGIAAWKTIDSTDQRKSFALEVMATQKAWLISKRERLHAWTKARFSKHTRSIAADD